MMLYADGNVLQVLEGEEAALLKTFRAIEEDPRHHGIFVLFKDTIAARDFANWSMGYRQLSKADLERFPLSASVFKARPDAIAQRVKPGDALAILKSFAEGSMSLS